MNLSDCYLEEDLFPKIFTDYEERDYGILFYNEDNKDTNFTKAGRAVYIQSAKAAGYRIIGYLFNTQISDQYEQYDRNDQSEQLYSKIIPAELSRLELPNYSEGFDELYYIEHMGSFHRDGDTNAMLKRDWSDTLQDEPK